MQGSVVTFIIQKCTIQQQQHWHWVNERVTCLWPTFKSSFHSLISPILRYLTRLLLNFLVFFISHTPPCLSLLTQTSAPRRASAFNLSSSKFHFIFCLFVIKCLQCMFLYNEIICKLEIQCNMCHSYSFLQMNGWNFHQLILKRRHLLQAMSKKDSVHE